MSKRNVIIVFVILGIAFLFGINVFLMSLFPDEKYSKKGTPALSEVQQVQTVKVKPSGKPEHYMSLDPSRKFYQNTIFIDKKEVARFKSDGEKIFDVDGEIPEGKVAFKNVTKGTHGEEVFANGKREGLYKEYFSSGGLYYEKEYLYGKIVSLKEYYRSGQLRMMIDYSHALWLNDETEVGDGKIFFKDGVLMYEWRLTNNDSNRYKKAYNYKGELVEIQYFDEQGNLIRKKDLRKAEEKG